MAITIKHELSQLRDVSTRMDQVVRSLETMQVTLAGIHNLIFSSQGLSGTTKHTSMIPVWVGKAADQQAKNQEELSRKVKEYAQELKLSRQLLQEAVAAYEKTEGAIQSSISQLDTKNIF